MTFVISGQFVVMFKGKKLHAETSAFRYLRVKYIFFKGKSSNERMTLPYLQITMIKPFTNCFPNKIHGETHKTQFLWVAFIYI